jgi:oligopeptide/dipeptide ABC transporter ATP-binding protein
MQGTSEFLLEVRGLSVTYLPADGIRIHAVDDLDFACAAGEVVGILGESGCGKSTLANAILQLLPRHALCGRGQIFFRGNDLLRVAEPELRNIRGLGISLVPQDPALSLNPVIKVGLQIDEVLRAHLALRSKERQVRIRDLLCEVGFDQPNEISSAYPHQLSGGQRQRIVIAQAIACKPSLLIADEPTSKLDAPLQTEIIALLARIRRDHGIAIVIISHDPALFAGFADRMAVMYAGRIVEAGDTPRIFRQPLHPYTQALVQIAKSTFNVSASQSRRRFAAIGGELPNPAAFPAGCRFHPRCPERMEICEQRDPQVFLPLPLQPVRCFKYGD